MAETSEEKF